MAERTIRIAEREFRNAVTCREDGDHVGVLKYIQECMEYAVKAVLIAYGMDYPKIHAVGRFLLELKEKYPSWFLLRAPSIAELTDTLSRGRSRFRYPYEYPQEQYRDEAQQTLPEVKDALESCQRLIKEIFDRE